MSAFEFDPTEDARLAGLVQDHLSKTARRMRFLTGADDCSVERVIELQATFLLSCPETWVALGHVLYVNNHGKLTSLLPSLPRFDDQDQTEETLDALAGALAWVVHKSGLLMRGRGMEADDPREPACQSESRRSALLIKSFRNVWSGLADTAFRAASEVVLRELLFRDRDCKGPTSAFLHERSAGFWGAGAAHECTQIYQGLLTQALSVERRSIRPTRESSMYSRALVLEFDVTPEQGHDVLRMRDLWENDGVCARTRNATKLALAESANATAGSTIIGVGVTPSCHFQSLLPRILWCQRCINLFASMAWTDFCEWMNLFQLPPSLAKKQKRCDNDEESEKESEDESEEESEEESDREEYEGSDSEQRLTNPR